MIISRDAGESKYLEGYRKQYVTIQVVSHNGPLTIVDGDITVDDYELAAGVVARYGQGRDAEEVEVEITAPGQEKKTMMIKPLLKAQVSVEWHI